MLEQYRGSSTVLWPETATAFFFMLPEKLAIRRATFYSSLERGISGYPGDAEMVKIRLLKRQLLNS